MFNKHWQRGSMYTIELTWVPTVVLGIYHIESLSHENILVVSSTPFCDKKRRVTNSNIGGFVVDILSASQKYGV